MTATAWIKDFNAKPHGLTVELYAAEIILRQMALIDELGTKYQRCQELLSRLAAKPGNRELIFGAGVMGDVG